MSDLPNPSSIFDVLVASDNVRLSNDSEVSTGESDWFKLKELSVPGRDIKWAVLQYV